VEKSRTEKDYHVPKYLRDKVEKEITKNDDNKDHMVSILEKLCQT